MLKRSLGTVVLGVLWLWSCSENQTTTPTVSPSLFRMAGGSATGNALDFLRADTVPSPAIYPTEPLMLPITPPYAQGPWVPTPDSAGVPHDSTSKSQSPSP